MAIPTDEVMCEAFAWHFIQREFWPLTEREQAYVLVLAERAGYIRIEPGTIVRLPDFAKFQDRTFEVKDLVPPRELSHLQERYEFWQGERYTAAIKTACQGRDAPEGGKAAAWDAYEYAIAAAEYYDDASQSQT